MHSELFWNLLILGLTAHGIRLLLAYFVHTVNNQGISSDMNCICQAMRAIINDRRYGALKSLGERKQAFNEVSLRVGIQ